MIAEFGAEIDVIPGEDGIAVATGHGIRSGHDALGHQGHEIFDIKVDIAFPGDAGMGKAAPQGFHGEGFQVVRGDGIAGGEAGAQAAAEIDEIEQQGKVGGEADGVGAGLAFFGQAEHLPHGFFVGKADDIMDRPAAGGPEIEGLGIGEIKGRNAIQDGAQAMMHRAVEDGLAGRAGLGGQFREQYPGRPWSGRPPW